MARKYKLTLWLAHQTWGQLSDKLANALQNTTRVSFALGYDDARLMAPYFTHYDPQAVKYALEEDEGYVRPVFISIQETYERMATALQEFKPRHAMVRFQKLKRHLLIHHEIHNEIVKIKTPTVKTITSSDRIADLREYYARKYLRSREEVITEVDHLLTDPIEDEDPPPTSFDLT